MTASIVIALAALCTSLFMLLAGFDSGTAKIGILLLGIVGIAGFGYNVIVWLLSGYGLPLPLKRDNADDERKAIMVFNKINAPSQNRRDTLVISFGAAVIVGLSGALFFYLF